MIYSPEIANPTSAVASAQVSAQVVKWATGKFDLLANPRGNFMLLCRNRARYFHMLAAES